MENRPESPKAVEPIKMVDLVGCPECGRSYLQKNIYRHLWNQHNWSREECKQLVSLIKSEKKGINNGDMSNCEFCGVSFKSMETMMRHRQVCASAPRITENKNFVEAECDEMIDPESYIEEQIIEEEPIPNLIGPSTSSNSHQDHSYTSPEPPIKYQRGYSHEDYAHEVEIYDSDPVEPSQSIQSIEDTVRHRVRPLVISKFRATSNICPLCNHKCESCEEMVLHCRKEHETRTRKFRLEHETFKTYEDFKKWFDQRQEDSCTSLTKRTGHGGETFYRCHMIGKYSSVAKKRRAYTRKLDQSCTAFLKVIVHSDGTTIAAGSFDHVGHELNHKLLWLTETQENYVKELIDLGWTSDQIYFYIREEYDGYECKLKYISKNDIRNITVRYERMKNRNPEKYREIARNEMERRKDGKEKEEMEGYEETLKGETDERSKQIKMMKYYTEKTENINRNSVLDRITTIKKIRQLLGSCTKQQETTNSQSNTENIEKPVENEEIDVVGDEDVNKDEEEATSSTPSPAQNQERETKVNII